jgi:hypothetical protein
MTQPKQAGHRVPITADTLHAAYTAHRNAAHHGTTGRTPHGAVCPTCRRYAAALTLATPPRIP